MTLRESAYEDAMSRTAATAPRHPARPRSRQAALAPGHRMTIAMVDEAAEKIGERRSALDDAMARPAASSVEIIRLLDDLEQQAALLRNLCAAGAARIRALMNRDPARDVR